MICSTMSIQSVLTDAWVAVLQTLPETRGLIYSSVRVVTPQERMGCLAPTVFSILPLWTGSWYAEPSSANASHRHLRKISDQERDLLSVRDSMDALNGSQAFHRNPGVTLSRTHGTVTRLFESFLQIHAFCSSSMRTNPQTHIVKYFGSSRSATGAQ